MRRIPIAMALFLALGPALAHAQDASLNPTYGSVSLKTDFQPDPYVKNLTAGGTLNFSYDGVKGYLTNAPDVRLYYTAGKFPLTFHVQSSADTTLLVRLPNGNWLANDDFAGNGLNPLIRLANPQSGRYDIWVGTFNKDLASAKLLITEYDYAATLANKGKNNNPPPVQVNTSEQEYNRLFSQAQDLGNKGKYQEALSLYEQILPQAESLYGKSSIQVANCLNNLALEYESLGQYPRAETISLRALQMYEARLGKEHNSVAIALSNLANLYWSMSEYKKSEQLYQRSLQIREIKLGRDHLDTAQNVNYLANLYQVMGEYAKALPLHERVVRTYEARFGPNHPKVGLALYSVGYDYQSMSKYATAEPYYKRCLSIEEAKYGKDNTEVAVTLYGLGTLYRLMGDFAKAEPFYERSLEIREAKFGKEHTTVASSLAGFGYLYAAMGQFGKAEIFHQRSLQIYESKLGKDHAEVAAAAADLGWVYEEMGQYSKAEPLYQRSLQIREAKFGKDHPRVADSLNNLGNLYRIMGQYAKAEPLYQRALQIRETKLGKDHAYVGFSINNLAVLYEAMGQYAKAEPLLQRSFHITEARFDGDHPELATSLSNLAVVHRNMGQYDKAESLFRRSLKIREARFGKEHPRVAESLTNLADLYHIMGRYGEAEALCLRGLQMRETILGKDHPQVAWSLSILGHIHMSRQDYAKAEPCFVRAIDIRKVRLGKNHQLVGNSLHTLAGLYVLTDRPRDALRLLDQARHIARSHVAGVLPMLSDDEQQSLLKADQDMLHFGLSVALLHADREEIRYRAASWLLNAKGAGAEAIAERQILARENLNPAFADKLRDLVSVRQEMAKLALTDKSSEQDPMQRQRFEELAAQEKRLAGQLHVADYRLSHDNPWIDLDDMRRRLPEKSIFVDLVRAPIRDFKETDKNKRWLPARYLAVLTPRVGEVQFVDLGPADVIDQAVRDVRKALEQSRGKILADGEIEAEKVMKKELGKLAALVLTPLRPHLKSHERWVVCPDSNLWLIPWAALPLDDATYVVEKHQVTYVTSGRDLLLNPLKLDQLASPPAIFADPDFNLNPAEVAAQTEEVLSGTANERAKHILGRRLMGKIDNWNVSFEFKSGGNLIIRDEDDKKGTIAAEGSWSMRGQELVLQTKISRFSGKLHEGRYAGDRKKRNEDGTITADTWHVTLPPEPALAWVSSSETRGPRKLGKVQRLPGTAAEAEAVAPALAKLGGGTVKRYTEGQATVGVFQHLKGPKVLVLSTHGFFMPDQDSAGRPGKEERAGERSKVVAGFENPLLRSGILLAGCNHASETKGKEQTGVLSGLEIINTDLRGTELVVLSACETGLGEVRSGEGVAGLRQAFQIAGAEAVVATLWQIPDRDSAILMSKLFGNLAAKQGAADALRLAQIESLRQRRAREGAAHPYFWAAFTYTGSRP